MRNDGSAHHLEIRRKVVKAPSLEPHLHTIAEGPWPLYSVYHQEMGARKSQYGAPSTGHIMCGLNIILYINIQYLACEHLVVI